MRKRTFCTLSMLNHSASGQSINLMQQVQNAYFLAGRIICVSRKEVPRSRSLLLQPYTSAFTLLRNRRLIEHLISNEDEKDNEDVISVTKITFTQSYLFCYYHFYLVREIYSSSRLVRLYAVHRNDRRAS